MSDDDIDHDHATGSDVPAEDSPSAELEGGDSERSRLPGWAPAVLRGGATIVAAAIVLAVAVAVTAPDESSSTDQPSTTATAAVGTVTTTAARPTTSSLVTPTTAATTSSAPATDPPPPTVPTDPRCASFVVNDALPVELCDEGGLVIEVQTALSETGVPIGIDGFFTSATEEAVLEFQGREGLEQDGVVGPQTAAALGIG